MFTVLGRDWDVYDVLATFQTEEEAQEFMRTYDECEYAFLEIEQDFVLTQW